MHLIKATTTNLTDQMPLWNHTNLVINFLVGIKNVDNRYKPCVVCLHPKY